MEKGINRKPTRDGSSLLSVATDPLLRTQSIAGLNCICYEHEIQILKSLY